MQRFGFVTHPVRAEDLSRRFSFARGLLPSLLEGVVRHLPPMRVAHLKKIHSAEGPEAEGWAIGCPLTARQFAALPVEFVVGKVLKSIRLAEKLGARVVGLGGYASIIGNGGLAIAKDAGVAVTTGTSYTIAAALEGIVQAAGQMAVDLSKAEAVVIGADLAAGSVCARLIARNVKYLALIGENEAKLDRLATYILHETGLAARTCGNAETALLQADLVILAASPLYIWASGLRGAIPPLLFDPMQLKTGAIVCDLSAPAGAVGYLHGLERVRSDVLFFEGGAVKVPGESENDSDWLNLSLPRGYTHPAVAETLILALEERYENFSLGLEITVERVEEIASLARKHGFVVAGFCRGGCLVEPEQVAGVKVNARHKLSA